MRKFWRVKPDIVSYRTPMKAGKIYVPVEIVAGIEINTAEMELKFANKSKREPRTVGDFTYWGAASLTPSRKAFDALEDYFKGCGRAYPIDIGKRPYVIFLIDKIFDAMDRRQSRFRIRREPADFVGHEDELPSDASIMVTKIKLRSDFETADHIFRLDGEHILKLEIIVSDEFYQAYHDHKLTGLLFQPVEQ